MKPILPILSVLAVCTAASPLWAVTTLPVGPITFSTAADYDNNFKESATHTDIAVGGSTIRTYGASLLGTAVYDTSATGGSGGAGGTAGSDANNDLGDFTVSSNVSVINRNGSSSLGYFLRLDDNEENGYLAIVSPFDFTAPTHVRIQLYEGVGIDFASLPAAIFTQELEFATGSTVPFNFSVTAIGGMFQFDVVGAGGSVSTSFTDLTPTATVGQVGVFIRNPSNDGTANRMDDFQITAPVPEPSALAMLAGSFGLLVVRRRK